MKGPLYYLVDVDTGDDDGDAELEVNLLKVLKMKRLIVEFRNKDKVK